MALYQDPGFSGLAQRFGLRRDGSRGSILPAETPGIGYSYLNSQEGAQPAYQLFTNLASEGQKRAIGAAFGDVYAKYKAAAALKPTLQWTDFLSEVDPNSIYHSMSLFERGERPSAYQGRYKYVSGG